MSDIENDVAAIQGIEAIPSILEVVCAATGMGFAAVARVTDTRWVACMVLDNIHFGLQPGGELPVATTLCSQVRASREEVVIDEVAEDGAYSNHQTPAIYGFQSYISVPIVLSNGDFFGTLCAIDPHPRKLKGTSVVGMFRLFAQLVAFHLDANRKLSQTRADLEDASTDAKLREQFIAVLGHDLRNPLAAIGGGVRLLEKRHEDPKSVRILRHMRGSVSRMSGLIDNLMDFARGRLGGGIPVRFETGQSIEPTLMQVVNEIRTSHPRRQIRTRFELTLPVEADYPRIAQMFSNLLGNAISHGAEEFPVSIEARVVNGLFELSVANGGDPIPTATLERLFQPFQRGEAGPKLEGLGLGLYIASQIAQAHGGQIEVQSDMRETRFTFRMPARQLAAAQEPVL